MCDGHLAFQPGTHGTNAVLSHALADGDDGAGDDIPGGATLQFQVELLSINT